MHHPDQSRPRVTIVMCARERHALTESAIDSVVAATAPPYRFIYLDVQSPAWLRTTLAGRAVEWGLEVVRFDEPLWPQQARRRVLERIDTDYVVFLDNDLQVDSGWLDALVGCADATGAGVVGPLYLWGDGVGSPRIHMAGGRLTETVVDGGRVLDEAHLLFDADPEQVAAELQRRPCDYVEFHCMLVRRELLDDATLAADVLCVHEHVHVALAVRQRGYPVYFEPAARVTYLAFAEYMLDDLPLLRWRWAAREVESSIAAFCRRWGVIDDARSFGGVRKFAAEHLAEVDPLRPRPGGQADLALPMRRDELRQTRSELLDLAVERGYGAAELASIDQAYRLAQVLMDGGYRPCGRPFLNHVTGTASVLVRYGFRVELVAAALLHAAYSHCPPHPAGPRAAALAVCAALGGEDAPVERRVRAYSRREATGTLALDANGLADLFVLDAEVLALVAANEIDMNLSGEIRYSGRADAIAPALTQAIAQVCSVLGVEGLARTLVQARLEARDVPATFVTHLDASYRIAADRRGIVPMVGNALAALETASRH
jgi:GT2 family glycosyltransferase